MIVDTRLYFKMVLYLCCVPATLAQSVLTLEDAVARVSKQNRQVLQSRAAAAIGRTEVGVAKSRRWPVLSSSVQAGPLLNRAELVFPRGALGDFASTGPIPENDTKIGIPRTVSGYSTSQIALPLLGQWRIGKGIQGAELGAQQAEESAQITLQQAVGQVRSLYFQLGALEASRALAAAQVKVAEEIVRLAEQGVVEGTSLPVEVREAAARLRRAQTDQAALEDEIASGQEQLNVWMGEPLEARFQIVTTTPALGVVDVEEAKSRAMANRPEIREARLRIRQAEVAVRSKQLEWLPDLDLAMTHYGFLNAGNLAPKQVVLVGLNLKWEPWDWGRKKNELAGSKLRVEQAQLGLAQTEAQAKQEASRAFRDWDRAQRELSAARLEKESSEEGLRIARQRVESQVALIKEVLQAQTQWEAAGQREARARAAAGTAWANLQLAMGEKHE